MSIHIGIGFCQDPVIEEAAKKAAFQAKSSLGQDRIDLALIFSTVHYAPEKTLPIISTALKPKKLLGCSTAGVITSKEIETNGIGILTITSDELKIGIGNLANIKTQDIVHVGSVLAQRSFVDFGKHNRHLFIMFMDGNLQHNSGLIKGIQEVFGNIFPIVGAGSSDDFKFSNTFQIFQDSVYHNSAEGLLLGGHVDIQIGSSHGWRPLGKPRFINQSNGNIIKTINNKKAIHLYEDFFGKYAEDLKADKLGQIAILYPLGILIGEDNQYLLRNMVDILPDGSIVCQGDVPEGAEVHIMIGNKDTCIDAALLAAQEAKKNLRNKNVQLILIIESIARLKLLGRTAFREIELIKRVFGHHIPIFGMYSNGEICPIQSLTRTKKTFFQNESIAIITLSTMQ